MPHLPPDIQYILDTSVEIGEITKTDFMYFLQRTNLDVINIFDTETNPIKTLMNEYDRWFQNLTDIEKSILFYSFLRNSEYELEIHTNQLANSITKFNAKQKVLHLNKSNLSLQYFKKVHKRYKNIEKNIIVSDNYIDSLNDTKDSDLELLNIERSLKYFDLYKKKFNYLKKFVKFTFDECMTHLNNGSQITNMPLNPPTIDPIYELSKQETNKTLDKDMKSMFKKSLKSIGKFIGTQNVSSFFNGDGFIIEGKYFNYEIRKKDNQTLLKPMQLVQAHIPYHLNVLDKNNIFLCNVCIVFKGCPVLDQVLSVYLMIKANQEKQLINTSNILSCSKEFFKNKNINKIIDTSINQFNGVIIAAERKKLENNIKININDIIPVIEKHNKELQYMRDVATTIKKQLKQVLFNGNASLYSFIFETDVCWDEMKDFNLMGVSDNRLDFLVNNIRR